MPAVAVIVAEVWEVTATVVMLNVAVFAPAETTIDVGTVTAALELTRLTLNPPVGAIPVRVIVPVTVVADPPVTTVGETVTLESVGGCTVREA